MRHLVLSSVLLAAVVWAPSPARAQQAAGSTVKTNVDEVLLDLIVRDKKGKPVTDLKPEDFSVLDSGVKQTLTSFRLVSASEAVATSGAGRRLITAPDSRGDLAFDSMAEVDQRKLMHRSHRSDQGRPRTNVLRGGGDLPPALCSAAIPGTKRRSPRPSTTPGCITGPDLHPVRNAIQTELRRNLAGQNSRPARKPAFRGQPDGESGGQQRFRRTAGHAGPGDALHAAPGCRGRGARRAPHDIRAARTGGWPKIDSRAEVGDLLHHGHAPPAGIGRALP